MKYLAFDIEAANGYKLYSICSIGIVIADEKFNIELRKNIWINPKTAYNLNGTRKNVGIDLHLDKHLLDTSPSFPQIYDEVKSLLTNQEYLVIGHAVDSDVRMLNATCQHYSLPSIDFNFICTQLLYRLYKGEKDVKALSKIAADLGITYNEHNSEDDAWMSMCTLKYLVQDSGMTVSQLLDRFHIRVGSNHNFELVRAVTLDGQVPKKHLTQVAVDKIKVFAKTVKPISDIYKNKVFCLARSLELSQSQLLYKTVQKIVENGGRYSSKLTKCNVYVKGGAPTEQDIMREKRVDELVNLGIVQVCTADEVLQGLTLTLEANGGNNTL